jgi:N-acetylmuramoyl-L-alanine amidase
MSEFSDRIDPSASPFFGMAPTRAQASSAERSAPEPNRVARSLFATMPVVLVGTLAMTTLAAGGAPIVASHKPVNRSRSVVVDHVSAGTLTRNADTDSAAPVAEIAPASVAVPGTYTVRHGDTVSGIANTYGLSTASVLALNGLSWKSLIFPGQVLKLVRATPIAPASVVPPTAPIVPVTPPTAAIPSTPAPAPVAPAPTPAPAAANASYTILRGDTITAIAKKFGVSVQAVLAANNLVASSMIYAGRTLVIPGTQIAEVGAVTVPLSPVMAANAQTIISVGRSLGVPSNGIITALVAAAQESNLQNLSYGDRDSVGLFQQRPSAGWGTVAQLTNTTYASQLFFGGPTNPNLGKTRGLLDIPGWQSMSVAQAAQAVQISAFPAAYAKWEVSARAWFAQLG